MVKLNLNSGTNELNMEGEAVIAIVIDPVGSDADCAALMLGNSSPNAAAISAGTGIGSIINQLGSNAFDRVMLAVKTMDQIKKTIDGSGIKDVEGKIFEGKAEEFFEGGQS